MRTIRMEVEEAVIAHVADYVGLPVCEVTREKQLFRDLGVDGDDAVDLIESFSKKFQVDIAKFDFGIYFGLERPFCFLTFIWDFICPGMKKAFLPLTVDDLIQAALQHSLVSAHRGQY